MGKGGLSTPHWVPLFWSLGEQPGMESLPHSGACGLQEGKDGSNLIRAAAAREASWRKGHQTSPMVDPLIAPDTCS